MAKGTSKGTTKLSVSLNINKNPEVLIDDRSPKVRTGYSIEWKKAPGSPRFTFLRFCPEVTPFENVRITDRKIECDFEPTKKEPGEEERKYDYTITVSYNGKTYNSDEKSPSRPTEGRAVIRN